MLPALLLLLAAPPEAPAAVSPEAAAEALDLAHRSAREYDLGHTEDALHDLERAYLLNPLPGLLFNLGQCHRALKQWQEAQKAFETYLRRRPDAANKDTVLQLIDEVKAEQLAATAKPEPSPLAAVPLVAPKPAPAEAAAPVVLALTPPAPAPAASAAAPEATAAKPASSAEKTKVWPWIFGATAVVAAGFAIAGFAQMVNYGSLKGGSSEQNPVPLPQARNATSNYAWGEPVGVIGVVVAVAGVGGAVWTW